MRVVIAPDSFGGTLTPVQAAEAIRDGWLVARPSDEVVLRPMSDGGEGLLDVIAHAVPQARRVEVEVVGPLGLPVHAGFLVLADGTAVIESAQACGLHLVPVDRRNPLRTTTWGVGQLLAAAADGGATRVVVGLGGSATVDGGAGALCGLGARLVVDDGSGLKVGAEDLPRVAGVSVGWADPAVTELSEVVLLADVDTTILDAPARFGPQKGADAEAVRHLEAGLRAWIDVVARDLPGGPDPSAPGTGAAGGLGFGLAAWTGGAIVAGAAHVARQIGLPDAVRDADIVVTGEGRVDATSLQGKVVGEVVALATRAGARSVVVAGQLVGDLDGVDLVLAPADERGAVAPVVAAVVALARGL